MRVIIIALIFCNNINVIMKNLFYAIILLNLLLSCKEDVRGLQENLYAGLSVSVQTEDVDIPIDENTLKDYYLLSSYQVASNQKKIMAYNDQLHTLDVFDLAAKTVSHISMAEDGPNAILRPIGGLYVHHTDSIWVYSQGYAFLLDGTGKIAQKIELPVPENGYIMTDANYSLATNRLFYNKDRNSLFYSCTQPEKELFSAVEYSLGSGSVKTYQLKGAGPDEDIRTDYGLMQLPNVTFTDNCILYNFPIESNIYRISLDTDKETIHGGQSKYTPNQASRCKTPFTLPEGGRHSVENVHFYEVSYDKTKKMYYRLHAGKSVMVGDNEFFKAYQTKPLYLMFFDQDLRVVDEIELENDIYSYITSWGVVDGSFFMTKNHWNDDSNDFEKYQLKMFSFKEAEKD